MVVDAVFTWVDGNDDNHASKLAKHTDSSKLKSIGFKTRYAQLNEIEYAVNSILKYAPFIRNIYIVTDNQIPNFLKNKKEGEYGNVFVVDHNVIFGSDISYLPVFNNRPIETKLYNIPDLAEHFIYFNDDMLLLKQTTLSDFFINEVPVIRGFWVAFNEDIFYKSLKFKKKKNKATHKKAQEKSAKLLGFKKLYRFHHVPAPIRKSTLQNFFKEHKDVETLNIQYKFRNAEQYTPQGLANHIEIKNNTCVLKSDYQLVFCNSYKKPLLWLKFKLNRVTKRKNKLFLNIQSLDQCPDDKLKFILRWLEKKYK